MALEKLNITLLKLAKDDELNKLVPDKQQKKIEVLFNPNTYTISKTVTWNSPKPTEGNTNNSPSNNQYNAPELIFGGGASRHLTMDLFFDVTEPIHNNGQPTTIRDVRELTDDIVRLTRITRKDKKELPPPVCRVMWGKDPREDFPFIGVLSNLTQRFTLFHEDGTPVRATLTVDFLEFLLHETDQHKTDPEQTAHTIKRGETLSSIAGEFYDDPALWRIIAEANQVDDPRASLVGQTLAIPKYGQG